LKTSLLFLINRDNETITYFPYKSYKSQLKAYSKRRFDSFCRWERVSIPCAQNDSGEECLMETTIGQLNFFKWAIENRILDYIEQNYADIERDMNARNSSSSRRNTTSSTESSDTSTGTDETVTPQKTDGKTRKKRQELTVSASKCIKKEMVQIVVTFDR
jgi:hypothetical protein